MNGKAKIPFPAGLLHRRFSPCRPGSEAGVPGAVAPGEIYFDSPPSPEGKGDGGMGAKAIDTSGKAGELNRRAPL